jgi:hypothetical protein
MGVYMIKKILLTLFLFFVISESSFGKSYLCMSEKMVMYGWSKDKGWQSFGMDDDVGTAFILKLTEDESKIKSLNRLKPKQTLCRESESSVFYTDFPAEKNLRCGGGVRTFLFNFRNSHFSYSDYMKGGSLYRLWLGECNKI